MLFDNVVREYDGETTKDGKYHGEGTAHFKSGHRYQGTFVNGFMEGDGLYEWHDGVKFKGQFKANRMSGTGEYTWKNGSTYNGQVERGLRNGKGKFVCGDSGPYYDGEWKDGKQHGYGVLVYSEDGKCKFAGNWSNGLKHGNGTMWYMSGTIYKGEWANNVKHGRGSMIWREKGEEYSGLWENGLPHGYGVYTWSIAPFNLHQLPMCNRYEGNWLAGKRSGHGVFQYASGARYEGEWKDNFKHGFGCYISENGRRYIGEFKNDRMVGDWPKFQNDCPFYFNLDGLISNSESSEETLKLINNVLHRHIGQFRKIYSHYGEQGLIGQSCPPLSYDGSITSAKECALSRVQLWKFLESCGLKSKGSTLVDMDRAYAQVYKSEDAVFSRYHEPHRCDDHFIFRDFIEALLRISHLIYSSKKDLSLHEHGIVAEFSYMIKSDILPNVDILSQPSIADTRSTAPQQAGEKQTSTSKDAISQSTTIFTETQLGSGAISTQAQDQRCEQESSLGLDQGLGDELEVEFGPKIYALYEKLARRHPRALPKSTGDKTITIRDFLHLLNEVQFLDVNSSGPLTLPRLISILSESLPVLSDANAVNLEFELVPYELFAIIYKCALIKVLEAPQPSKSDTAVAVSVPEGGANSSAEGVEVLVIVEEDGGDKRGRGSDSSATKEVVLGSKDGVTDKGEKVLFEKIDRDKVVAGKDKDIKESLSKSKGDKGEKPARELSSSHGPIETKESKEKVAIDNKEAIDKVSEPVVDAVVENAIAESEAPRSTEPEVQPEPDGRQVFRNAVRQLFISFLNAARK